MLERPKETFKVLSQPPDLAILFNNPGKKAKKAKGRAMAIENPRKPMIGPSLSFCWLTSISRLPIKGAVHEKETSTNVSAIKKIPDKLLSPARESALFVQEAGNVISKAPRNDIPNSTNKLKTNMLKMALLDIW